MVAERLNWRYAGDVQVLHAIKAGARGYLLKGNARTELLDAIRTVHAGQQREDIPLLVNYFVSKLSRQMKFASSRTFPLQGWVVNSSCPEESS